MPTTTFPGVNNGGVDEFLGWPLDFQVDQLGRVDPAQVETQPAPTGDRHVGASTAAMVGGDPRCRTVPEPGHNPGGLGGIGRSDVVADKGVDESGFSGLECASQRDAQRFG